MCNRPKVPIQRGNIVTEILLLWVRKPKNEKKKNGEEAKCFFHKNGASLAEAWKTLSNNNIMAKAIRALQICIHRKMKTFARPSPALFKFVHFFAVVCQTTRWNDQTWCIFPYHFFFFEKGSAGKQISYSLSSKFSLVLSNIGCKVRERTRWTKSCAVISYLCACAQDTAILPARACPFWNRQTQK